jgi:hypothetical protein
MLMEKNDNAFNVQMSSDRPGSSEGIGLPSQSSGGSSTGTEFGAQNPSPSSGLGNRSTAGFGVQEGSDRSALGTGPAAESQSGLESDAQYHECAHCGHTHMKQTEMQGFDKILGTVGLNEEAIRKMRESLENLDLDGYFTQAKEYFGESAEKAKNYAKDHKKAVIGAALAIVAVGAGVLIASKSRSSDKFVTPRIDERDLPRS